VSESKGKKWVDHELLHEGTEFEEPQEKRENSATTWLPEKLTLEAFLKHDLFQQKEASNAIPLLREKLLTKVFLCLTWWLVSPRRCKLLGLKQHPRTRGSPFSISTSPQLPR
jgi:hypothetical protein